MRPGVSPSAPAHHGAPPARCGAAPPAWREARYGLRGIRIGESRIPAPKERDGFWEPRWKRTLRDSIHRAPRFTKTVWSPHTFKQFQDDQNQQRLTERVIARLRHEIADLEGDVDRAEDHVTLSISGFDFRDGLPWSDVDQMQELCPKKLIAYKSGRRRLIELRHQLRLARARRNHHKESCERLLKMMYGQQLGRMPATAKRALHPVRFPPPPSPSQRVIHVIVDE